MKKFCCIFFGLILITCMEDDEYRTPEVMPVVCSEVSLLETTLPFIENFEGESIQWIQKVEAADRTWELDKQEENHFMNLSAFRSNNTPISLRTWLISPLLNFNEMTEKVCSFKIADAYQNGNPLHVYISNDYDGKKCPSNYTWSEIGQENMEKLINNSGVYDNLFEWSGNISLEEFKGKGVIAFVYQSESTISTTLQLDDIVVGKIMEETPFPELVDGTLPYSFSGGNLSKGNWIQHDVLGALKWKAYDELSVNISGYNTNGKNKVFLVTPRFDFDLQENEILKFETKDQYDNGKVLTVYYSNDFDGTNYETASWKELTLSNQSDTDGEDTPDFIESGIIDLSFIKNKAVIAFVYESDSSKGENQPGPTTSLDLANIKIEAKPNFNVFFSEIADPKNNVRTRFVELYNTENKSVDLSNWTLKIYKNGSTNPEIIPLSGSINSQAYFVIGNTETDYLESYPEASLANLYSNKITGNGDDVYELIYGDYTIDIYGVVGVDGTGEDWEYTDGKAVRRKNVLQPNEQWILNEWDMIIPATTEDMTPGEPEKEIPENHAPVVSVFIEGEKMVGDELVANTDESSDQDGDFLTFTYQWFRADDLIGTNSGAISGAVNETYSITSEDKELYLSVQVIAYDGTENSEVVFANYVGPIEEKILIKEGIFISEIADPDNNTNARFVELYNSNSFPLDLEGWKLKRYTNENTEITASATLNLSGTIDSEKTFVIAKDAIEFENVYGFVPGQDGKGKGAVDSNGDDQIVLEAPDGMLVDIFGVIGEDGSGTHHEFEDGRANRKLSVTTGNTTYTFSEWDIWNDTGGEGTINEPQNAPDNFTPGAR